MSNIRHALPDRYNVSRVLFDNLTAGRGDRPAIFCEERVETYADLAESAGRCGNALRDLGLGPGARILLLLLDTPELPAAFFGAIRAGYLPIPVSTALPESDYAFFIDDSEAEVILVSEALQEKVAPIRAERKRPAYVVVVGDHAAPGTLDWGEWTAAADPELDPAPSGPEDPAFWLYSSGSTGFPKGVIHLHRDIACTIDSYARQVLEIDEEDVFFSASKAFHAYGLGNSLSFPYSLGARTVLFPGRPTPEAIFERIRRFRPTLFFTAPTLYANMLAADPEGREELSSLRLCVSAAEALPPEIYSRWLERYGVEILDGIGSTELLHIFISNRPGRVRPGSSGEIVPGYDAKIVDEQGGPVPAGESGDLMVVGGSAAPSYWNRPDRTAHTMRGDWIFTGDRYHRDEDGFFFYEGRSDDMFKVSGLWVSPIEVENALLEHEAVLECAVVAFPDGADLVKPKAFVVPQAGADPTEALAEELRSHVKRRLAPHKYPRRVEFVDALPKTATGKIQRFQLRG